MKNKIKQHFKCIISRFFYDYSNILKYILLKTKLIWIKIIMHPPVAKLDIAADSDSEGRGFESLRADQSKS